MCGCSKKRKCCKTKIECRTVPFPVPVPFPVQVPVHIPIHTHTSSTVGAPFLPVNPLVGAPHCHTGGFLPPHCHTGGFLPPHCHTGGFLPPHCHTGSFFPPHCRPHPGVGAFC